MFFLVPIDEDGVFLNCPLSTAVFTTTVPTLVLDFIRSMMTVTNPIRQMTKATPRQTAEMRTDLHVHSVLPTFKTMNSILHGHVTDVLLTDLEHSY